MERKIQEEEIWKPSRGLKWYYDNREKALRQNKEWAQKNVEKRRIARRKSYHKNLEKSHATAKKYRDENREKVRIGNRVATKKWHQNNKEYHSKLNKKWVAENPERVKKLAKEWKKKNPDKDRATNAKSSAKRRSQKEDGKVSGADWAKIKTAANNKCHYCKKKKPLSMDHVIPLSKGGAHLPSNIVPACKSCNSKKHNKIITLL